VLITVSTAADNPAYVERDETYLELFELVGFLLGDDLTKRHAF
jgi:hypothetical protein